MDTYDALYGKTVIGSDGEEIGKIDNLYTTNDKDDTPVLATISTGWLSKSSFMPLAGVEVRDEDTVIAPYTKDRVKHAPEINSDEDVSLEEGEELYDYYNLGDVPHETDTNDPTEAPDMTVLSEETTLDTYKDAEGRVHIRKYVVTDSLRETDTK